MGATSWMHAHRGRALTVAAAAICAGLATPPAGAQAAPSTGAPKLTVPHRARQLIVVSSRSEHPARHIATLRVYARRNDRSRWHRVFGGWRAEIGIRNLIPAARRREGDHATPIGVFGLGSTIYGNRPRPRGLHHPYHRLRCGDWWDEDPYTRNYNRFVHVPCGYTPAFASWSEALWTETVAYPYFAVIRFNMHPIRHGRRAPGSAIFLHSWVGGPTEGCVAIHERGLLRILRWLRPAEHPMIEIGTVAEVQPQP